MKSAKGVVRFSLMLLFLVLCVVPVALAQSELLYDEFNGTTLNTGPNGWTFQTNSGNNGYYQVGQGQLILYSGTTDGGGGFVNSNQSFAVSPDGTDALVFETRAKTSSTDGGAWGFLGFVNDDIWNYTDGMVLIGVDRQTNWLRAGIRSSRDVATTYLPVPGPQVDVTDWHVYRIEVSSAVVKFYIDGELRLTHTDNIPIGKPMRVRLDRVSRGAWQTVSVDYAKVESLEANVGLTDGLIVCLPFDGDITDSQDNVNTVALGSPEFTSASKLGTQALSLNESGVDDLIRVDVAPPREDFTYMAWINPRAAEGPSLVFSSWYTYYNDAFRMGLMGNLVWSFIENGYKDYYSPYSMSNTFINNNVWYHIVGVKNNNVLTVYVNGIAEGSYDGWPSTVTPTPMIFGIGNTPVSPNSGFAYNGIIDDAAVWSRALSDEEINAIYNNGLGKSCANLQNSPPIAIADGPYTGEEGSPIFLNRATALDDDDDALAYSWSIDSVLCTFSDQTALNPQLTCAEDGTYTATLTASDGINDPVSDSAAINVSNADPVILSVTNDGPVAEGGAALVSVDAMDPGGNYDPISYEFDCDADGVYEIGPQVGDSASCGYPDNGAYAVNVRVTDDDGGQATGATVITVANVAPTANAGPDQTVYRNELVSLLGSWSDPAGSRDNPYAWLWDLNGDGITDADGQASYGDTIPGSTSFALEGNYTLTFSVTDKDGDTDDDQLIVAVVNRPPVCEAAYPSRSILWPVNHKFSAVEILGITDPEGDATSVTILSIYQDEPVDSNGDGQSGPDGQGIGTSTAEVRAERSGTKQVPGNGRVYHITFVAADGHGGMCTGTVFVGVPHDKKDAPVDDGPLYDSTVISP